jgi:apolipoprotein N-acyltransferase
MSFSTWPVWLRPHHHSESPVIFRLVVAALSGAALALCYTGIRVAASSWVCVGLLMIVLFGARPFVAALCGFLHGFAFVLGCLSWIATVLQVHGGLTCIAGIGVLLLIAAAWGLLIALFAWAVNRLAVKSVSRACLAAPFVWVAVEFLRNYLPEIGFPWNLLGYPAAANLAFVQLTAVTGIFGLSFVVAAYNALLAWANSASDEFPARIRYGVLGGVTLILLVTAFVGPKFVPQGYAGHAARLIQPNFPEEMSYPSDWFEAHKADMADLERLSLQPGSRPHDLLVWPEVPAPFSYEDRRFAPGAYALARAAGVPFLSGVIEWKPVLDSAGRVSRYLPYNSAVLLDAQGKVVFSYDKVRLVPFGEYEPFPLIHRVVKSLSDEVGGFAAGNVRSVGELPNGHRFGAFICYEAVFPGEVRQYAAHGAELLINVSNDGWFGHSAAPDQHLRMARVRAVENRRWLLRDTNNGYTVAVDPYGRIAAGLAPDERSALDAPYDFRTDRTLYVRWGDWIAWLCVFTSVFFLLLGRGRSSAPIPERRNSRQKDRKTRTAPSPQ